MDSAIRIDTGEFVTAEELWDLSEDIEYECFGCGIRVFPAAYKRDKRQEYKVRPYFRRRNDEHGPECNIDGINTLVQEAENRSILTKLPSNYPLYTSLKLKEENPTRVRQDIPDAKPVIGYSYPSSSLPRRTGPNYQGATTIRPLCRQFERLPYDRSLKLEISGIQDAKTYATVFRPILDNPKLARVTRILYAPIYFAEKPRPMSDCVEIDLAKGDWSKTINDYGGEKWTLSRRVMLRVNTARWTEKSKTSLIDEIDATQREFKLCSSERKPDKGYIFFLGQQDLHDPYLFHVDDRRLICAFMARNLPRY